MNSESNSVISSGGSVTLLIGLGALFSTIGILIGASNTPVLGAVLTGFLGLVGTIATVLKVSESSLLRTTRSMLAAGFAMIVISATLLGGVFLGETYRRLPYEQSEGFPWKGKTPPAGVHEAIDWMLLADRLEVLGYDDDVVTSLYSIREAEVEQLAAIIKAELEQDSYSSTSLYDSSRPYSSLLEKASNARTTAQRGPASADSG